MTHTRIKHFAVALTLAALPLALAACGGQEAPKTQVKAPEVAGKAKEAKPEAPPAPPKETVPPPAPVSDAAEVAKEIPVEAPPVEEKKSGDTVPELLSANDEVLIFFPSIHIGDSMEAIIHNFVQENFMNLVLTYLGDADAMMAEFKDNKHIAYCKNAGTEGIMITSAVNREANYAIAIVGKDGKVFTYFIPNDKGNVKKPRDYPPLAVNFTTNPPPPEMVAFVEALIECKVSLP